MSSSGWTGQRHIESLSTVIIGELPHTPRMVFVLCFKGDKHDALPQAV